MDRIFIEFANGCWLTSDGPDFQADLAEMVAQYGRPVLVEFRAKGEGYAPATPCEDCGLSYAQCHCDDLNWEAKAEPSPSVSALNLLHDAYLVKYGHLLETNSRDYRINDKETDNEEPRE